MRARAPGPNRPEVSRADFRPGPSWLALERVDILRQRYPESERVVRPPQSSFAPDAFTSFSHTGASFL